MKRTEFLLARIAEEQAYLSNFLPGGINGTDAAIAGCEAKRRIVEDHASSVEFIGSDPQAGEGAKGRMYGTGAAVAALALPYADHPDYREEWKP